MPGLELSLVVVDIYLVLFVSENASSSGDGASGKRKKVNAFVILEDIEPSNSNNKEGGAGADCIDGEDELDRENTINEGGSQNPDVPPTPNDS